MLKFFFVLWLYIKYQLGLIDFETAFKEMIIFLTKVNLIFVKLCQWLTYDFCNDKIIANRLSNFIESYCEHAPYSEEDIDYESLKEISHKMQISQQPDFSGSIALCYLGEYKDKKVIVKIKRKNIQNQMDDFVSIINYINYLLKFLYKIGLIQKENLRVFKYIQNFVKKNFLLQLDFKNECNNIKSFYNICNDVNSIFIPFVYEDFTQSNANVIVMDYLVSNKKKNDLSIEELKFHSKNLSSIFLISLIEGNIVHGDCHIGNVVFMSENNDLITGLIDFGLLINPSTEELNCIFEILEILFNEFDSTKGQGLIYVIITWLINNEISKKKSKILSDYRTKYKEEMLLLPEYDRVDNNSNIMKFSIFCIKNKIVLPEIYIAFSASFGSLLGCCAKLNTLILEKSNENFNTDTATSIALQQFKEKISKEYQKY